jgi:hypothetical protein
VHVAASGAEQTEMLLDWQDQERVIWSRDWGQEMNRGGPGSRPVGC